MARLRIGQSYWLDAFGGRSSPRPPLHGHLAADVAIMGGGVTGCAAALMFARAGARVVLVESKQIGRGSTAASTALLMQEPDTDLVDLARRFGPDAARRIWRCSRAAVGSMRRMLSDLHAPRCMDFRGSTSRPHRRRRDGCAARSPSGGAPDSPAAGSTRMNSAGRQGLTPPAPS